MTSRQLLADRLAGDLSAFVRQGWHILHPIRPLVCSWHLDYICEYLTLVKLGQIRRLIVNVPPRSLKSTLVTIMFPVWLWASRPEHSFLTASYSLTLSTEHSVKRRNLLQSAWYQHLWGEKFRLAVDRNLVAEFENDHHGAMISTSVGATTLGRGGDTAIVDDPTSIDQAMSDVERTNANNWLDATLRNRLNDPATGAIIVVMQRLHECDATGYLLEEEPGVWTHVRIPLEAEEDESRAFPLSGRVLERTRGQVLMPSRYPAAVVEQLRSRRLIFAGQFQQRPVPAEGNLIKRSDLLYYGGVDPKTGQSDEQLPSSFDLKLISVDCAFKDLATSDYVALGVIGVKGRKRYLLNVINAHLDAGATEAEVRRQRQLYGPVSAVLIEDKANGPAIISRLKADVPGVIGVNPQGGKVARMYAAAPEFQAGDWLISRNAPWAAPLVEQIVMFPNARNDDMADMVSQAVCWLIQRPQYTCTISNAFTGEVLYENGW